MHEMAIAGSLVELIEEEGRIRGFSRVRTIRVRFGVLGHVEPEALMFCFDAVSRGTRAEGAQLALDMVAGEGWCPECRQAVAVEERYALCPLCGLSHVQLTAGEELRLTELEVM